MQKIKIINFPFCNFYSLERYLRMRKYNYSVLKNEDELTPNDTIIIPGVGTFAEGVSHLQQNKFDQKLYDHALNGGKIIGICLGMQMLLESSEESPKYKGLGLIKGNCQKIPGSRSFSVPHIGWNTLHTPKNKTSFLKDFIAEDGTSLSDYYFVHSFYALPKNTNTIIASFSHPIGLLTSVVLLNKIIGFQFHPEKSGKSGYNLLDKVINI